MSQAPMGSSLSTALRFARRKRGIIAILTAFLVLAVATHASVYAEENQYQHAFSHVTNVIPALRRTALRFDKRVGLAKVDKTKLTTHPVRELIERAHRQYEEQQIRIASIRTLEDAVEDYKQAFGMDPPRGFDTWYKHAVENNAIQVPSMLGQAVRPLKPFLSYPAEILQNRLYGQQHEGYAFCVVWQREGDEIVLNVTTPQVHRRKYWTPPAVKELYEPLLPLIPRPFDEDPDTFMIFGWEDAPTRLASYEIMQQSHELAEKGLMWNPDTLYQEERKTLWSYGWAQMCPPNSPFRQKPIIKMEQDMKIMYPYRDDVPHPEKSFIFDNQNSMDWCEHPILTQMSSTLVQDFWRRSGPMFPMFGPSRLHNSPELTWCPTMAFKQRAPENTWEGKTIGKILWRGNPTGMLHANTTAWRSQQRHRITHMVNFPSGTRNVIVEDEGYLGAPVASIREYTTEELVDRYANISFTGRNEEPPFCWHDGTCEELVRDMIYHPRVEPEEAVKFRYILDIDGWGWSSRFRRELTTGSVMIKATIFPEWYFDIIIPWYHYVPLQMDYSDLWDIMAFFEGAPDGSTPANIDLAQQIGDAGKRFVDERWRLEDLHSFSLLQILEYQRMWSSDRKKASYGYRD